MKLISALVSVLITCQLESVDASEGGLRHLLPVLDNTTLANTTDTNTTTPNSTGTISSAFELLGDEEDIDVEEEDEEPEVPAPANDLCENAQEVTPTSGSPFMPASNFYSGTTVGAANDQGGCNGAWMISPGVWYKVQGTGGPMIASTCSENTLVDARVRVFSGGCDGLVCVGQNNNDNFASCNGKPKETSSEDWNRQASLSWNSQAGVMYYILVAGSSWQGTGPFELSITAYDRNDQCPGAHMMPLGLAIRANNLNSQFDSADTLEECGFKKNDYQPEFSNLYGPRYPYALWYAVTGTGNTLRATTCPGDFLGHRIHVFEGSCDNCLGGDPSPMGCITYDFDTNFGETYFVAIHRTYHSTADDGTKDDDSASTPFELTITEVGTTAISRGQKGLFD